MQNWSVQEPRRPDLGQAGVRASGESPAIRTVGLSKHYRNPWTMQVTRGLESLDLEVRRGEVMGYLGPNGAGKTTTLKLLTGLLKPTSGRGWLLDEPIENSGARRRIGFLPEQPYFYDYLKGEEYLELAARLSGLDATAARERSREWLDRVGLGAKSKWMLRKYSKGMLQRIGLAAALVHGPEVLILDEPMSGLDPLGRRDVREIILEQRARGTTVLFSSHILPDVEMLCDRVAIVLRGRLTRLATVGELVEHGQHRVEVRCVGTPLIEIPPHWIPAVSRIERPQETAFALEDESLVQEVLAWLLHNRVAIRAVTPQRPSLEELYVEAAEAPAGADAPRRTA